MAQHTIVILSGTIVMIVEEWDAMIQVIMKDTIDRKMFTKVVGELIMAAVEVAVSTGVNY